MLKEKIVFKYYKVFKINKLQKQYIGIAKCKNELEDDLYIYKKISKEEYLKLNNQLKAAK